MLLLDNSAWARLGLPTLAAARRDEVADMIERGDVAVSAPFLLEAGWSARSGDDHGSILDGLLALPMIHIDAEVESIALTAQRELARRGHLRTASPSDLLIAACAQATGAGVLHYDRDYDVLAELTGLAFASEWLAPAGTLS